MKSLSHSDLLRDAADACNIERRQAEELLKEFLINVKNSVAEGESINIRGFGTISAIGAFEKSDGRGGRVRARCRVRFQASEPFKALIDQNMNKGKS